MGDAVTIFSAREDEPTEAVLRGWAGEGGAEAEVALERRGPGALRVRVAWPDLTVLCDVAAEAEVRARVARLLAYAREMSTDPADPLPARIAASRQVLAVRVEPGFDDEGRAEALLAALARERDALVFRAGRVADALGACLLRPPVATDGEAPAAPSPLRVARRALVLSAVVCRASLEQEEGRERAAELHERLLAWLDVHDLSSELEPQERGLLGAPLGSLPRQVAIDASWRSEGLAVLGWALHAADLPAHDRQADPQEVASALGFLGDEPPWALERPWLRDRDELELLARLLHGVHWRLQQFALRPGALDLRRGAPPWLDGAHLPLIDGDLALRGASLARCDQDVVVECSSIAFERHQAIAWLTGEHDVYSEVDPST